nr:hypothetical protein [Tanacetum cinerariifolium]
GAKSRSRSGVHRAAQATVHSGRGAGRGRPQEARDRSGRRSVGRSALRAGLVERGNRP